MSYYYNNNNNIIIIITVTITITTTTTIVVIVVVVVVVIIITIIIITHSMKKWKTTLNLHHANESLTSRPINISSQIFQGDPLSPLLFCIALTPHSTMLNRTNYGYEAQNNKVHHLLYMDDLKTIVKNGNRQTNLLTTVKAFNDDIKMGFALNKWAKKHIQERLADKNHQY